jgi:hypothetical protein
MALDMKLTVEQIREMFDHYDVNKDGAISCNELQRLCEDLGVKLGSVCSHYMATNTKPTHSHLAPNRADVRCWHAR